MIFVPIYEEVLFRGILFLLVLRFVKLWPAIILVSFLFAIWHVKNIFWLSTGAFVYQVGYTFILSLILCYVTYRVESIWPAIILHFINNVLALLTIIFCIFCI